MELEMEIMSVELEVLEVARQVATQAHVGE